ncbi:MAG: UDP-2,3-diacylglucosamine diphosphatase, partial [Pseudorhodoplanes sp.]|nr:UDP-2,3-diacylglucosamine diphosphatase [Pseudorhodoplanes sp.]
MPATAGVERVRALFLSDVHLGSRSCRGDRFADFLRHYRADTIYLVGDIVDGWRLSAHWYWPSTHSDVLLQLLGAARQDTKVVYVPGNHDAFLRDYCGVHFGGIEVCQSAVHRGADGRRYLVIHGDHFDRMMDR